MKRDLRWWPEMGEMGDEGWKGCGEDIAIVHHFSFPIVEM